MFRVNHTVCINSLDIGSQNGYPFRQWQEHSKFTDTSSGQSGANLVPTPFIGQMSVVLCSFFFCTHPYPIPVLFMNPVSLTRWTFTLSLCFQQHNSSLPPGRKPEPRHGLHPWRPLASLPVNSEVQALSCCSIRALLAAPANPVLQ